MKEFPPFRLDTVNQCLWRDDGVAEERIPLAPKALMYCGISSSTPDDWCRTMSCLSGGSRRRMPSWVYFA